MAVSLGAQYLRHVLAVHHQRQTEQRQVEERHHQRRAIEQETGGAGTRGQHDAAQAPGEIAPGHARPPAITRALARVSARVVAAEATAGASTMSGARSCSCASPATMSAQSKETPMAQSWSAAAAVRARDQRGCAVDAACLDRDEAERARVPRRGEQQRTVTAVGVDDPHCAAPRPAQLGQRQRQHGPARVRHRARVWRGGSPRRYSIRDRRGTKVKRHHLAS
ncbi:hypothetical protein [Sphingomonas sp. BK345]|uniref:hypothetical protein n=1 Tax=Sphingomonas sp. BK345 TaxID=2586980 RepID=UPI001620D9DD|nr:hypothetical protein [Sphingomonas sp. BK345]MBB3474943.1 cell pole-organizing protein PopZ [Sphingomonas sp. BK345]